MRYFIKPLAYIVAFIFISCGSAQTTPVQVQSPQDISFLVNLLDRSNDTFKVQVTPPELSVKNNVFQFAATAPGTYETMNIGRYVSGFKAYDSQGNELETKKISINQYQLAAPEKIAKIEYQVAETWDTPVKENKIYLMCGTSIEDSNSLINGQAVFGYFKGMQSNPVKIKIAYPKDWRVGTALKKSEDGYYLAKDYDQVVDSPFLLGNLTKASMDVEGTKVDIYTYSKSGMVTSDQILSSIKGMLLAASGFLNGLPVKHYTFLFHFEDTTAGAWEHSYSSEYVYKEGEWKDLKKRVLDVAAHEFFHVVTPLNIHSEIIEHFNFVTPVPSEHLWLYEGTTEWASHMMLMRSGLKSLDDYFKTLKRKVYVSNNLYSPEISLVQLSKTSYTPMGHKIYNNIYMKGALVAGLLDIKLIELSHGNIGLVDVINRLAKKYGPNKPFDDATFFDTFTKETYPEIKTFFDDYVIGSKPLHIKEYYEKIGVHYDEKTNDFSLEKYPTDAQLELRNKWMQPIDIFQLELLNTKTVEQFSERVSTLDNTIKTFYGVISGEKEVDRNWKLFKYLFLPGAKLIPIGKDHKNELKARYLTPEDYIKSSNDWMDENGYFEKEIHRSVDRYGNMAQIFSTYESFRSETDKYPFMRGINSIQLLFDGTRWWIVNVYWAQETKEQPIPTKYLISN